MKQAKTEGKGLNMLEHVSLFLLQKGHRNTKGTASFKFGWSEHARRRRMGKIIFAIGLVRPTFKLRPVKRDTPIEIKGKSVNAGVILTDEEVSHRIWL